MRFNPDSPGQELLEHPFPGPREDDSKLNGDWWNVNPERDMKAEMQMLEAQYEGLQTLVGELLVTNQQLRMQVAELKQKLDPTELAILQATHPQPLPGH
jgi:hypothetical protein